MRLLIKKKPKDKPNSPRIWYDPFFKEPVTLECDGYTIRTKYAPYCILNDKPIKIDKAIELYKEHNGIKYDDDYVLLMMKSDGLVHYGYIQEPQVHNESKNDGISPQDSREIVVLLDDYGLNYSILNQKSEGITIEIDEIEDDNNIEDFLLQISKDYEHQET